MLTLIYHEKFHNSVPDHLKNINKLILMNNTWTFMYIHYNLNANVCARRSDCDRL